MASIKFKNRAGQWVELVVDNLTTESAIRALSAKQGKILQTTKADKSTTLAGYGIADAYTKTEIDALIAAVFKYQGVKATVADVEAVQNPRVGDVWFVTADGSEYAWNGTVWEKLGPVIDLSHFITSLTIAGLTLDVSNTSITAAQLRTALSIYTKAETDTLLANKVDKTTKINGHALSGDVDVTKSDVGLGNVDNTSDTDKPVSTAQQAAINAEATARANADTSEAQARSKADADILSGATPVALAGNFTSATGQKSDAEFIFRTAGGDASINNGDATLMRISGNRIHTGYVDADNRGTITVANPQSLISTGWNLYNHTLGYAKVCKYSSQYGFRVGGTYTALEFSSTVDGTRTSITIGANDSFTIPEDGYVFVTGGNDTDTYIINHWSDWIDGPTLEFETYHQDVIDLSSIMSTYFPNGLMRVGNVRDYISPERDVAISYIERLAYSDANLEIAVSSGRAYEADTNYIYLVRSEPISYDIELDKFYKADDHGNEIITGTTVPVLVEILYGNNLKNKLERDVVTISQQTLTAAQQQQVRDNLGITPLLANLILKDANIMHMIADDYNSLLMYAVGDLAIHDDNLYACTIAATGTWDATKWSQINLASKIAELKSQILAIISGETEVGFAKMADNLQSQRGQVSEEAFIIRTTGGDASLSDGSGWYHNALGRHVHNNYVAQSVEMTVNAATRTDTVTPTVSGSFTVTINEETFMSQVSDTTSQSGTVLFSYTNAWDKNPATYGITISGTPVSGDSISVAWSKATNTITATVVDDTFIAAEVSGTSGTETFTYTSAWDNDPTDYGIIVTGTPINGDEIVVVWQKEIRGTILQSYPTAFHSTGWNLYDHTVGYARVIKYHDTYGFGIDGDYTSLSYSSDAAGTEDVESITPVDGRFTIPADGYIHVTGGNDTDTQIWMTWSDWQSQANGGIWQEYSVSNIDFSALFGSGNALPYGLCEVGSYCDEINLNLGTVTRRVERVAYSDANLATVKGYGVDYEYDEDYIYYGLTSPVETSISIEREYVAYDHGLEFYDTTEVPVFTGTMYGNNLKNKLERDVVTISQQSLTETQSAQVRENVRAGVIIVTGTCTTSQTASNATRINDSRITSDMVASNIILGTPTAQTSVWYFDTYDGYMDILGTCAASTTVTVYLEHSLS